MTDAERLLWKHLRRKQICGVLFNRQKPLLNFIVDFYCAKAKLGLRVLRFDNRHILLETESVLEEIYCVVCQISPNPSLSKRGTKKP